MKTKETNDHEKNCDRNENTKLNLDDIRYIGRPFGIIIQDKYCKCNSRSGGGVGGVGAIRYEKYAPTYCTNLYDKMTNDVSHLDKSSIYTTKRNWTLNQFFEYNGQARANESSNNRFSLNKCRLKKSTTFGVSQKTSSTVCLQTSVFADKRLVSLFRSVALYWFFCLNTVLSKGDFRRRTSFELQNNVAAGNFELRICPDVLRDLDELKKDLLLNVLSRDAANRTNAVLDYADHSMEKFSDDLFKKVLLNMANSSGMLDERVCKNRKRTKKRKGTRKQADIVECDCIGEYCDRIVLKTRTIKNKSKCKRKSESKRRNERQRRMIVRYATDDERATDEEYDESVAAPVDETDYVDGTESATKLSPEIEDTYYLPDGVLNAEEKYPKYDLWRSPLLIDEDALPQKKAKAKADDTFRPYRLWESSSVIENIRKAAIGSKEFSVFSMPCRTCVPPAKPEPSNVYSLWGSPNIIDFLPSVGGRVDTCGKTNTAYEPMSRREDYSVRSKFLDFKPVVSSFVTFTDDGAFEYYKKPKSPEMVEIEAVDEADEEVCSILSPCEEFDANMYFKPIQPAVKVQTDMPAFFERSESGAWYCNERKWFTYKHESDDGNGDAFRPKYAVSTNDVACQTDDYWWAGGYANDQSLFGVDDRKEMYSGAAFYYSLEEVFNYLGKPGLGNIDVKAHVDFSCMF